MLGCQPGTFQFGQHGVVIFRQLGYFDLCKIIVSEQSIGISGNKFR